MKLLFIGLGRSHFKCYESIMRSLVARGHEVVLTYRKDPGDIKPALELEAFVKEFPNVKLEYIAGIEKNTFVEQLAGACTVSHYLRYSENSLFYLNRRVPKSIRKIFMSRLVRWLMATGLFYYTLRGIIKIMIPTKEAQAYLESVKPDFIIASPGNSKLIHEMLYLKAARKLKIPAFISVLSWDNLSTKSMFLLKPDRVFIWNKSHYKDALQFNRFSPDRLTITGATYFDRWFDNRWPALTPEELCAKMELESNKPFILYLGSSANIAKDETWAVRELWENIQKKVAAGALPPLQMLVRPHPENQEIYRQIEGTAGVSVYPPPGSVHTADTLYHSLKNCFAVVGINTSAMLETMIFNKPVITIVSGQYSNTQEDAIHFKHLVDLGALYVCKSNEEAPQVIADLLNWKDPASDARKQFVTDYIRPFGNDKSSGSLIVRFLEELKKGKTPREIEASFSVPYETREAA